jgi:predicted GIY-YIG superfamily endonuclease
MELVYSGEFETRYEATKREKKFKSWKSGKAIERFTAQSDRVPI